MPTQIIEIKARCFDPDRIHQILMANNARFVGTDHQIDTYFEVPRGRLKLREGNIERTLIHYHRPNQAGPKRSDVTYQRLPAELSLKPVLVAALKTLIVVDKKRKIYFIDNVKFHIDEVVQLGSFVEIEAIDETGELGLETIRKQCNQFKKLLDIKERDLIEKSYSDLMLPT